MRRAGTFFLVLMLCISVVGFYRGWFTFTVDPDKVKKDAETVKEKTTDLGNQARDKVKSIDN
ncbi:MAG: hypothetical protein AABZ08_02675 [Planctomycetota bacterium]